MARASPSGHSPRSLKRRPGSWRRTRRTPPGRRSTRSFLRPAPPGPGSATARPELYERRPAWAAGARHATTMTLSDLSDADTLQLVSLLLDASELPLALQTLITDGADGNPLYAEEYVRLLHDRGLLVLRG